MILQALHNLLLPNRCIACAAVIPTKAVLCVSCGLELPIQLDGFSDQNPSLEKLHALCEVRKCYSLLLFHKKDVSQHLLHHMKYKNRPEIGVFLAQRLWLQIGEALVQEELEFVLPIPIHKKRKRKRGYNQAAAPARFLAERLQIPCVEDNLIRVVHSISQTTKNKAERITRMQGSFALQNPQQLHRRKVLLVDDILTTGATIAACAQLLRASCQAQIYVATLARG